MEKNMQKIGKFSQSTTWKGIVISILTLLLLIPGAMIESLIFEREQRSIQSIEKINDKWSNAQTVNGPYLIIPYQVKSLDAKKNTIIEKNTLFLTPEKLNINAKLTPEERHYGIYKSILYRSAIEISGDYRDVKNYLPANAEVNWQEVHIRIGISDLRGISNSMQLKLNDQLLNAESGGKSDAIGQGLQISVPNAESLISGKNSAFSCLLKLNGSGNINFIPAGKTTRVQMDGLWKSPGFIGSFTPEYSLNDTSFRATWNILHFNRNIPEYWTNNEVASIETTSFGVNLVDTVDHYQQNMRSVKYAFLFIALTFVVFFFVEIFTGKRIHPIQYLLVGIALILFYSLLLSISEHLNFTLAYLIAGFATITLIVTYAHRIFRNFLHSGILTAILVLLYTFLYVVLQLEEKALLIGSIGLFVILGIIMYVSGRVNWYKTTDTGNQE